MKRLLQIIIVACSVAHVEASWWDRVRDAVMEKTELTLASPDLIQGKVIPQKFTCIGKNIAPALVWRGVPLRTKSFIVLVEDRDIKNRPDAFVHWLVFNIPAMTMTLEQGGTALPKEAVQGKNSFGTIGYRGPCSPSGQIHYCHFSLYALDTMLDLPEGATKQQVMDAAGGHIIASDTFTRTSMMGDPIID
ncbi:YbhB/YbcL family Raf kinase inhibitor-like protein [Candidatus Babeliales bacterium]|nr:YbhB/YbcL family Raf kinase inhibitor-like protein [Candidatus Babeliales bacterium]